MREVKIYTRFNPPPCASLKCKDASLTRQEFVQEADLNNIMKRYAAGMPLPTGHRMPMYGDFSDVPDYQRSFEIVAHAQDAFMALPSEVRRRFGDDPSNLIAFLQDEKNRDEAVKLGLVNKPIDQSIDKPADKPAENVSVPVDSSKGEGN